jgi:hypothetical protein
MPRLLVWAALFALTLASSAPAATYHVGNSLTWDALYGSNGLAGSEPAFPARGYHVRCSMPLPYIWEHQQEVCTPSPAPYGTLDGLDDYVWDAVTIQPHVGSTLATDTTAITSMIDLARVNPENAATKFFVYETWPQQPWGPYQEVWTATTVDEDAAAMSQKRSYYDALYARVDANTDAILRYVPAGEVLYRLSLRIAAGELPGVTDMSQFYRDELHLNALGQYVVSTTMFAAIDKLHPVDVWPSLPAVVTEISPSPYETINQTILDVMLGDRRVGLGDFNDDGLTDGADLALWTAGDLSADGTLDGVVDGADLLLWQRQAQVVEVVAPEPPEIASVPEPVAIALMATAMAAAGLCRRGL